MGCVPENKGFQPFQPVVPVLFLSRALWWTLKGGARYGSDQNRTVHSFPQEGTGNDSGESTMNAENAPTDICRHMPVHFLPRTWAETGI